MAVSDYSRDLCRELRARMGALQLEVPQRLPRYEDGDTLELSFTTAWPETPGRGRFRICRFVGGGFAGQVYRSRVEALDLASPAAEPGLRLGGECAVKILVPPEPFAVRFRDAVYWLAFQSAFSPQVNRAACRFGLLWPKLLRVAADDVFGNADAIANTYASFYDPNFHAHGEIREWVEGRTWRLEADSRLRLRKRWRSIDAARTGSPEYVAKRQFMTRLVALMHDMGAKELARQYEWSTMKSQPNVLKRTGAGRDPGAGLCAVDFRAGLALLPFLPMSPGDFRLILEGLRRGTLAQFDRCDFAALRDYMAARPVVFRGCEALVDALERYDREYRRAMPDLTHHGWTLAVDPGLRRDVRCGLVEGYRCRELIDDAFADRLAGGGWRFPLFYLLGGIPLIGRFARKCWGHRGYRCHVRKWMTSLTYLRSTGKAAAAAGAVRWHRAGRIGERHARRLADNVWLFWLERSTLGLLPLRKLHRITAEPLWAARRVRAGWRYLVKFFKDERFRETWLREQVEEGYRDGMLHEDERDEILAHIGDPFIVKYLGSVGVHLATLPVTQVVSVFVGLVWASHQLFAGASRGEALGTFLWILGMFQLSPISPGSICRGLYVVALMIMDRNWRDYMIAAPLAFLKYVGYLSFPLQMTATYPSLSQFMAGRWATRAVRIVPVFGEKGALLEHMVFDLFFNISRGFGRWSRRRIGILLSAWMLIGSLGIWYLLGVRGTDWTTAEGLKRGVNLLLTYTAVFVLPRVLFYPVLRRRARKRAYPHT